MLIRVSRSLWIDPVRVIVFGFYLQIWLVLTLFHPVRQIQKKIDIQVVTLYRQYPARTSRCTILGILLLFLVSTVAEEP